MLPELLEQVEKGLRVDRLSVSLAQAYAVLLSHGGYHALIASVDVLLLYSERGVLR